MAVIEWAPLSVPLERRLQTLAAGAFMTSLVLGTFISIFVFAALLIFGNIYIRTLSVLYMIFIYLDRFTADMGGRGVGAKWMRSFKAWKYYGDYFPVKLVKTAELSPERNHMFAIFPHGIISTGVVFNFGSDWSEWKNLFPGIRPKLLTLGMHFTVPFFRELLLSWGLATVSADVIRKLLTDSNNPKDPINADGYTSNAVGLIVGGAQEALYSRPGNYQIFVQKRKGFVKLAISCGSTIVPVFSFGEVDLFNQVPNPPSSLVRRFQEYVKKKTGITPALFYGRGFLQYSYGIVPKRRPITTVVGAPIEVKKNESPTTEEINEVHATFVKALVDLFDTHKHKYITDADNVHLILE